MLGDKMSKIKYAGMIFTVLVKHSGTQKSASKLHTCVYPVNIYSDLECVFIAHTGS